MRATGFPRPFEPITGSSKPICMSRNGPGNRKGIPITTFRNRYTTMSATLVLAAALVASGSVAQAKGGGAAMAGIRVNGVNTLSGGNSTGVRDHRGNHNGEGGVTITSKPRPPSHSSASFCIVSCGAHLGPTHDHRTDPGGWFN